MLSPTISVANRVTIGESVSHSLPGSVVDRAHDLRKRIGSQALQGDRSGGDDALRTGQPVDGFANRVEDALCLQAHARRRGLRSCLRYGGRWSPVNSERRQPRLSMLNAS